MANELKTVVYPFDEVTWGVTGVGFDYDATPEIEDEIRMIQKQYPELADWGDLSLFTAWGSYSQDHHDLKWQSVDERDVTFLGYLYHVEHLTDQFHWTDADAARAVATITG